MLLKYTPIALVVLSSLGYHLFQKSTPTIINPLVTLIVTYAVATFVSLQSYFMFVPKANVIDLMDGIKTANWASILLGFAVVGLELGFLLSYRAGWNISSASLISNTMVALVLIPVGLLLFKESISLPAVFGVVLCLSGLIMVSKT